VVAAEAVAAGSRQAPAFTPANQFHFRFTSPGHLHDYPESRCDLPRLNISINVVYMMLFTVYIYS
jgi:hypothetical protein